MLNMIMALALVSVQAETQVPEGYPGWVYEDSRTIQTVDERDLHFYLDHPDDGERVPLLLLVDGSSCVGQLRPNMRYDYRPGPERPARYARLMVEKPGVAPEASYGSECTEGFLRHYTIDNRVLDHLRVLQHLRATADWWNGELLVWGWSDGGDIASQLVAYYPQVTRAVLGAMGGGYTMAEHFEDFWACPEERVSGEEREACIADLRAQFERMEDNPTWRETWSGHDNSWAVWPTRLNSRLVHLLEDNTMPILIVHGEKDRNGTPVESARALVDALDASGNTAFEYWEIPCMGHGWGNLPEAQGNALEEGMLDWLLGQEIAADGPPRLGQPEGADCPASD
ncbi:alpha/beta hydrolase family protein [Oceanicaulis sp. LC35]|uniref:alpha/beta hydrolase family protein n=1 Tax=Oceanicaulis sp. LC35 TaxID=3349635 RepID=UPI003F84C467